MDEKDMTTAGLEPFCDKYGFDFRLASGGYSTGQALIHECALALDKAADWYSDPSSQPMHPLAYLAALTRAIARNGLSDELAQAYSVIARHAWRLQQADLNMIANWAQTLADQAQSKRTRRM